VVGFAQTTGCRGAVDTGGVAATGVTVGVCAHALPARAKRRQRSQRAGERDIGISWGFGQGRR
jgi:hypothetical protein